MAKRRRFFRPTGKRPYRRKVILAVEGSVTEPLYFSLFNSEDSVICVKCLKGKHDSAPKHVLKRMEKYIKSEGINNKDQAWLVVDKDSWSDDQLMVCVR
ncbi:RloB domain-containing protein [bacterium]|nr:RloB domain-containing protein [bacterium]